jgi:hypothetical protein
MKPRCLERETMVSNRSSLIDAEGGSDGEYGLEW